METDETRLGDTVEKLNKSLKNKNNYISKFKSTNEKIDYRKSSEGIKDYREVKSSFRNLNLNLQLRINGQRLAYQLVKLNNK